MDDERKSRPRLAFPGGPARAAALVVAVLAVGALAASGCGDASTTKTSQPDGRPFEGAKVRVAVPPGSGLLPRWQSLLIEWSARTGAEAEVVEADVLRSGTPRADGAGTGAPETEEADLLVFPIDRLPSLAAVGRLAPMPQASQSDDGGLRWSDVPRGLATNLLSVDRQPVAAAVRCPVLVLYFRKDLLAKAGLAPPQTWDDYQKLLDTLDQWAPGLVAVEPWHPAFRAAMFLARSLAFARHPSQFSLLFDIETGAPLLDSPAWERGLETALAALKRMPPETLNHTPADCRRLILEGQAALAIGYETPSDAETDANSASDAGKAGARDGAVALGVSRLPGTRSRYDRSNQKWESLSDPYRVDLAGFDGLAVGVSSKSMPLASQAAWNLLGVLSEPGFPALAFPGSLRSLSRKSHIDEGRRWHGAELTDGEGREFLTATLEALSDPRLTFAFPVAAGATFQNDLADGLGPALKGEASPKEALAAVQKQWKTTIDQLGADIVRDSLRRQYGLSPLGPRGK